MSNDNIFNDFEVVSKVTEEVINKYSDIVPNEILNVWIQYGFGNFFGNYLKAVNPDDYQDIVKETYVRNQNTTVLFTTAMGDLILWENNGENEQYVILVNYRKGKTKVLASRFELFLRFLEDDSFKARALDWQPYPEAVNQYGKPDFDECFGYAPLIGLGGSEKVENLKKVKIIEHIYLITQFMGPVE